MTSQWPSVQSKLREAKTPDIVEREFRRHYECLSSGAESFLRESEIRPVESVVDADRLDDSLAELGRQSLAAAAVLKLNGGLGTSMGLAGPKSLLQVRGTESFLDLILRQSYQHGVPLVLMNSFSTDRLTAEAIEGFSGQPPVVMTFLQHQVPKIDSQTMQPAEYPADPTLQWCPPGHGDIYAALVTSGTLKELLDQGRRFLFVSNADNLGATLDLAILGHFIQSGKSFLMEVADRTAADRKGGHLACDSEGRLLLREKAQCHPEEEGSFQDVSRHRFFNTNNLWIDLQQLQQFLDQSGGVVPLPTIANRKTVDPKDQHSTAVYQLETAMGAAIAVLPDTDAIRVPRSRFAPVKTTGDLLAVRSDAYETHGDYSVGLIAKRDQVPPDVKLDGRFFKTIGDLQQRFVSAPSLSDCESMTVHGNISFADGVRLRGNVVFNGDESAGVVPAGTYEGENRVG